MLFLPGRKKKNLLTIYTVYFCRPKKGCLLIWSNNENIKFFIILELFMTKYTFKLLLYVCVQVSLSRHCRCIKLQVSVFQDPESLSSLAYPCDSVE